MTHFIEVTVKGEKTLLNVAQIMRVDRYEDDRCQISLASDDTDSLVDPEETYAQVKAAIGGA